MKPTIYIASKIWHAPKWRALKEQGHNIIASWIDPQYFEADGKTGLPLEHYQARFLWDGCAKEPAIADVTIIYAEQGDVLKGGLIECGAALGAGKFVIQVGSCASLEAGDGSDATFTKHHRWYRADSIDEALSMARGFVLLHAVP